MDWQERVAACACAHGLLHDPAAHALNLASEVGEVAKEVLRATDYGRRAPELCPALIAEVGDALYSWLALAESCSVDAGEALEQALNRYQQRLNQTGTAGSQR
jgi:NTP pyrophosphatase (non-canonical NTP hydrolase)